MSLVTALTRALGIAHPIIQAPMGGANTTPPELVAAVSEAGALGFIGAAYMSPEEIERTAAEVRARTSRPFAINLFAPVPSPPLRDDVEPALGRLAPHHAELGIPAPAVPTPPAFTFDQQLEAAVACGAAAFSFTFGLLPPDAVQRVKSRGMYLIGTSTTVDEAVLLERSGVDAVVAQGSEAGAHRGTFAVPFEAGMVGTIALVPQVVDAVDVPVIASGGIMDGRGIAAALVLGAQAVQMGTAFLACDECGVAEAHKRALTEASEDATRVTRVFSGRPARGIVNRFVEETEAAASTDPAVVLPYPHQNALTRPMRTAAAQRGRADLLALWAGQGVRLVRRGPAATLVRELVEETDRALSAVRAGRD